MMELNKFELYTAEKVLPYQYNHLLSSWDNTNLHCGHDMWYPWDYLLIPIGLILIYIKYRVGKTTPK